MDNFAVLYPADFPDQKVIPVITPIKPETEEKVKKESKSEVVEEKSEKEVVEISEDEDKNYFALYVFILVAVVILSSLLFVAKHVKNLQKRRDQMRKDKC